MTRDAINFPIPPSDSSLLPRRTLPAQFVSLLLLPLVLAFVLAAVATVVVGYAVERGELAAQRQALLDIYGQALIKPLWDCDSATVAGVVDTLAYQPEVRNVQLEDLCANQVVSAGLEPGAREAQENIFQREIVYVDEQGRRFTVGHLLAQFHPLTLREAAMSLLWRYLAIFGAVLVVMLAGAVLIFHRIIGQPLGRFRNAINEQMTDKDASALPRHNRNDELGDVMNAYAGLMLELERRYSRQETLALGASSLLETHVQDRGALQRVLEDVRHELVADSVHFVAAGAGSHADVSVSTPLLSASCPHFPRWPDLLRRDGRIAGSVSMLPDDEGDVLTALGVRSVAVVSVWGQTQWYGFLCVQDKQSDREWSDSELIFLQTLAGMVGAYLESDKHREELAIAIDKLRANEKILMRMARIDPLTGLGNRLVMEEQLPLAIARAGGSTAAQGREPRLQGYVLLIDLDGFKPINDTYGHTTGDAVLQEIARRLQGAVGENDTVVRLGGDEFVVVLDCAEQRHPMTDFVASLIALISTPMEHEGHVMRVGASIGTACFPVDGTVTGRLLAKADAEMYTAKQGRKLSRSDESELH